MTEFYEVSSNTKFCKAPSARLFKLQKGDIFTLRYPTEKIINSLKDMDNIKVIKVVYEPKKWWQFWKKRKIFEYKIMCIKDLF